MTKGSCVRLAGWQLPHFFFQLTGIASHKQEKGGEECEDCMFPPSCLTAQTTKAPKSCECLAEMSAPALPVR